MQSVGRPKGVGKGDGKTLDERKNINRLAAQESRRKATKRRRTIASNLKRLDEYVDTWRREISLLGGDDMRHILDDLVQAIKVIQWQSEPDYKYEADLSGMCGVEFSWGMPERAKTPELPDLGEPLETFSLKDVDLFTPIEQIEPVFKKF